MRVANAMVRIDAEADADQVFSNFLSQSARRLKAERIPLGSCESGFVTSHQTVSSTVYKNHGVRLECLFKPVVSFSNSARAVWGNTVDGRVSQSLREPCCQMHFWKVFC